MRGQQAMDANPGSEHTNARVFFDAFCPLVSYGPQEAREMFERFYLEEFSKLKELTCPMPGARSVVEWALGQGWQVAIATGFQSTLTAVELRLAWAGVPATEFDYVFLTTIDNMHASKPHPGYYREVLEHLNKQPNQCLMVGDNWTHDVVPAASIGIDGYWVASADSSPPKPIEQLVGHGSMRDLRALLEDWT
jgi:HAD superfamily hydrolase (TIGR01549 family)